MFLKNSQKISPKVISLVFGVLVLCFALGFWVLAWEEPGETPPGDNVPAPLNVGTDAQTKSGYLTFPTFYDFQNTDYYVDPAGGAGDISAILSGKVGIGTINPGYELDVSGDANATRLCITGDCRNVWPSGGGISCSDCDAMFQDDIGSDCGSGKYTYGVLEDGTLKCRGDQIGGGVTQCSDCDSRFVNEGQVDSITSGMIVDGAINLDCRPNNVSQNIPGLGTRSWDSVCNSDEIALGGGVAPAMASYNADAWSEPVISSNKWHCTVKNHQLTGITCYCFAQCCKLSY